MAEENLWTKLSFDVDLQKGEAKEVESAEQEQVETEEAGGLRTRVQRRKVRARKEAPVTNRATKAATR